MIDPADARRTRCGTRDAGPEPSAAHSRICASHLAVMRALGGFESPGCRGARRRVGAIEAVEGTDAALGARPRFAAGPCLAKVPSQARPAL